MNNYNYYPYSWYKNDIRNNMMPINNGKNEKLFNPKEGFEKGNMFESLYSQYKNYKAQALRPRNEQEQKLFEIQAITFAAHDLNLYLDMHPEDQSMITLFNDYRRKLDSLVNEYESMYGPMTVNSDEMENKTFSWVNSSWPWEVDNV